MHLCCLCNELARHWFPPKLLYRTQNMQPRRDTPRSCRAHSPALHVGRRDRVASRSWSCTSHPHAHLHAQLGLICICRPIGRHLSSSSARARMHPRSSSRDAAAATHRCSVRPDGRLPRRPPEDGCALSARPWPTPCRSPLAFPPLDVALVHACCIVLAVMLLWG